MKSAIVPLAPGVEEMEAVIIIDILRRAGWKVVAVGLDTEIVAASRGVRLVPDACWKAINPRQFDVLAFPGGLKGSELLHQDVRILETVTSFHKEGKLIGAICAAPLILHGAGILAGRTFTSHPSVRTRLPAIGWTDTAVVVDKNIVTGKGAGITFEFALTILRLAGDPVAAEQIEETICLTDQRSARPQPLRPLG